MSKLFRRCRVKKQEYVFMIILSVWTFLLVCILRQGYFFNMKNYLFTINLPYLNKPGRICYRDSLDNQEPLIKSGSSIFLITARCNNEIGLPEACYIESIVRNHPQQTVYLLFPKDLNQVYLYSKISDVLRGLHYLNLSIQSLNIYKFVENTPLQGIFTDHFFNNRAEMYNRVREVLKFAALYKYGGVVIDLEMVIMRSVEFLGQNWAPKIDTTRIGSGVLAFNKYTIFGKRLLEKSIELLIQSQNETVLDGGLAIKKAFEMLCNSDKTLKGCQDFKLYEPNYFYRFNSNENYKYSQPGEIDPNVYGYYVWNKTEVEAKPNTLSFKVMQKHCPSVHKVFKEIIEL